MKLHLVRQFWILTYSNMTMKIAASACRPPRNDNGSEYVSANPFGCTQGKFSRNDNRSERVIANAVKQSSKYINLSNTD